MEDTPKLDRSGNFGCVNYDNVYECCTLCGICENEALTEEDCEYDPKTREWRIKEKK